MKKRDLTWIIPMAVCIACLWYGVTHPVDLTY